MAVSSGFSLTLRVFLLSSFLLPVSSCLLQDTRSSSGAPTDSLSAAGVAPSTAGASRENCVDSSYRVGVGDELSVNVRSESDSEPIVAVRVPVRIDGMIGIPLAGDVHVGYRSVADVTTDIAQKLKKHLRDPIVKVDVPSACKREDFARIRVIGAMQESTTIPYRQGMSVLEVVLEAGGTSESADLTKVILYLSDGTRLPVRLDHILQGTDMSTNYTVLPASVLVVHEIAP